MATPIIGLEIRVRTLLYKLSTKDAVHGDMPGTKAEIFRAIISRASDLQEFLFV